jgi:hypothetical protein
MKQVDLANLAKGKPTDESMQKVQGAFTDALSRVGITIEREGEAQEAIIRQFGRLLDNRYTMLQNVPLAGQEKPVPLVLIGPPGIVAINPRGEAGVFRAREDAWVVLNRRTQQYEVAHENPMLQSQAYAKAMEAFLQEKGFPLSEVQPMLALTNPAAHVESSRPIVRILPVDALDRYIATLVQGQSVLDGQAVQRLIELLSTPPEKPPAPEPEEKPKSQKAPPPLSKQVNLPPMLANFKLTKPQWIFLVLMAFFEVTLLIILFVILLINA